MAKGKRGKPYRPVTVPEMHKIGELMCRHRRLGRSIGDALTLAAGQLGRHENTVRKHWYEGISIGHWADPGATKVAPEEPEPRHRSLAEAMGAGGGGGDSVATGPLARSLAGRGVRSPGAWADGYGQAVRSLHAGAATRLLRGTRAARRSRADAERALSAG